MLRSLLLLASVLLAILASSQAQIIVDGVTYGVSYTNTAPSVSGSSMGFNNDNRLVLLAQPTNSQSSTNWALFNFVGKTLTFTVDLSATTCGCNAAVYMVSMGGLSGYCDANSVGGVACPEMDLLEANTNGIHVTPHCCCSSGSCTGNQGSACLSGTQGSYSFCDQWGIAYGNGGSSGTWGNFGTNAYGPGSGYTINTQQPFTYSISFPTDSNGLLSAMITSLSQNGRTVALTNNLPLSYIQAMTHPLQAGMALVFSLWSSSDMTWLDGGSGGCSAPEYCSLPLSRNVVFSNFYTSPASSSAPATSPAAVATTTTVSTIGSSGSCSNANPSSALSLYANSWCGDLTYYGALTNIGNCGLQPFPSWMSGVTWGVAMNANQYASGNLCQACGVCLRGNYLGTGAGANPPPSSFTAVVVDQCPECATGSIDVATAGDGRFQISWTAVDCPVGSATLNYEWQGSNIWYMKLGVRNHRVGITNFEVQQPSGAWVTATRTQDNFFNCGGCTYPMSFPLTVRITGVNGQQLIDQVPSLAGDLTYLQGSNFVQFSSFHP